MTVCEYSEANGGGPCDCTVLSYILAIVDGRFGSETILNKKPPGSALFCFTGAVCGIKMLYELLTIGTAECAVSATCWNNSVV